MKHSLIHLEQSLRPLGAELVLIKAQSTLTALLNCITALVEEDASSESTQSSKEKISRVGVFCGGPSAEREISLNSARSVIVHIQDDDAVNAEAFINKPSFMVSNSKHEVLTLQYKVCYARILDLKRKFLEAKLRYCDISETEKRQMGDEHVF